MDGIIGLIIIISFIIKLIDGDKKKGKNKQEKHSGEQWQQLVFDFVDKAGEYAGKKKEEYQSYSSSAGKRTYSTTNRSRTGRTGNDAYYYTQQQRATKERLQQKYGSTQSSYAKTVAKTDIVTRAKGNVAEKAQDAFKQEAHADVCTEYRSHAQSAPNLAEHKGHSPECDFETESDIMKRVNDLIVMGYSGEMTYERDFIAEGVDMLNSFTL